MAPGTVSARPQELRIVRRLAGARDRVRGVAAQRGSCPLARQWKRTRGLRIPASREWRAGPGWFGWACCRFADDGSAAEPPQHRVYTPTWLEEQFSALLRQNVGPAGQQGRQVCEANLAGAVWTAGRRLRLATARKTATAWRAEHPPAQRRDETDLAFCARDGDARPASAERTAKVHERSQFTAAGSWARLVVLGNHAVLTSATGASAPSAR